MDTISPGVCRIFALYFSYLIYGFLLFAKPKRSFKPSF
jgi:hypothetical protein